MNIYFPEHLVHLTERVQHCLLVANRYGFDIDKVRLSVSRQPWFVVKNRDDVLSITTDLFEYVGGNHNHQAIDLFIRYRHDNANDIDKRVKISVAINLFDKEKFYDTWSSPQSCNAIFNLTSLADSQAHFCWLITLLALDFLLEDAIVIARGMDNVSRETWPIHIDDFPKVEVKDRKLTGWLPNCNHSDFLLIDAGKFRLYPVVDSVDWLERCLKLGVKTVQLRIKNQLQSDLEAQIIEAVRLGNQYSAQVFINDYWQLAIKHHAYGVHLGQDDLSTSDLERMQQAGIRLGVSTHGYFELLRSIQISPSYIALGHIFPTSTKQMPSKPQGLVRLGLYQQLVDSMMSSLNTPERFVPTVAIGGIDLDNAAEVLRCGVNSIAVVRAITQAKNCSSVVSQFEQIMDKDIVLQKEYCDAE